MNQLAISEMQSTNHLRAIKNLKSIGKLQAIRSLKSSVEMQANVILKSMEVVQKCRPGVFNLVGFPGPHRFVGVTQP